MSNYAPDPKKEQMYTNLQNKTLGNVESQDIQRLTDPTFIQATNQDALITYNAVNNAAFRMGAQPIPDRQSLLIKSVTGIETSTVFEVLTPKQGESYLVGVLNWEIKGGNTSNVNWWMSNQPLASSDSTTRVRIAYMSGTGPDLGNELPPNLYVSYPNNLQVEIVVSNTSDTNVVSYVVNQIT